MIYGAVLLAGCCLGWLARGSSAPGEIAPEGRVVGTRSVSVVTIRDPLGRELDVLAGTWRILPEVV